MCGIAGTLRFERDLGSEELEQRVLAMAQTLVHRGPDDDGVWVDPERRCALSHRRLSVIDLSARARQPMRSQDGRMVITYNGEIYNYLELRSEVEKHVALRTQSDTEVLLELLRARGASVLQDLDGMYAFAAFDTQSGELLLARDPFGEKPLYYTHDGQSFSFASELRALRALPGVDDSVALDAIAEYMALQYIDAPRTLFRGIRKLEPGHLLRVSARGEVRIERHFDFRPGIAPHDGRSIESWADELEEILVRSLRRRLVADVPLGAFLSGGIDSSLTCALVRNQLDRPLRTFTLGFEGSEQSEHEIARRISGYLGTEHSEEVVGPQMADQLEEFAAEHDEPNGDASCWPVWRLAKLARRHVTVALSGDGGDELFGGYQRYLSLPPRLAEKPGPGLGAWFFGGTNLLFSEDEIQSVLGCVPREFREVIAGLRQELDWDSVDALSRMRASDVRHYLPGAVLAKVDRMSMRHSLELRSPFLSRELAAFAERLPNELMIHEGKGKRLLRHLLARHLPAEIFEAPKRGFGAGMTGGWAGARPASALRRCLDRSDSPLSRVLDSSAMERLLSADAHPESPRPFGLSALLTLEGYLRQSRVETPRLDEGVPFETAVIATSLSPAQVLGLRALADSTRPVDVICRAGVPDWFSWLPGSSRLLSPNAIQVPGGNQPVRCGWGTGDASPSDFRNEAPRTRLLLDWPPTLAIPAGMLGGLQAGDEIWSPEGDVFGVHPVDATRLRFARARARLRPLTLAALRVPARALAALLEPAARAGDRTSLFVRGLQWGALRVFAPERLGRVAIPLVFSRANRGYAAQARWTRAKAKAVDLSGKWHVYEDGRPLSRPASPKAGIRRSGRGRYRVERPNVFFSSSDGTDPLENRRLYSLQPRTGGKAAALQRWLRDPSVTELGPTPTSVGTRASETPTEADLDLALERIGEYLAPDPIGAGWPLARAGEPVRVCLVAASLGAGGAERQLTLQALEWIRRGAQVEVMLNEFPNGRSAHFLPELRAAGARIRCVHPRTPAEAREEVYAATPTEVAALLRDLPGEVGSRVWRSYLWLRRFRPHFVLASLDTANVCAGLASAFAGVPAAVLSARSVNPTHYPFHRTWYRAGYRAALRSPRVVMGANSRFGGDDYAAWLGIDPGDVRVVHNGLDATAFVVPPEAERRALREEIDVADDVPLVLGVMRFTAEKQPVLFVDVLAKLLETNPEACGLLVGDGPMADEVRERAAQHGLGSRLRLLGARYDVRELLSISSLALVTSAIEGHPNIPLEAQAQGVPVVATRAGGLPETVVEGETALLADCDDAQGLARHCADLLGDAARRERFRQAGLAHAEAHFRVARLVDENESVLKEVAS